MKENLPANCTIDLVCEHIASGGTVHALADIWEVKPDRIFAFLRSTEGNRNRWNEATVHNGEAIQDRIKNELGLSAFADLRDAFDENGDLKATHKLSPEIARAIGALETKGYAEGRGEDATPVTVTKIKFNDKLRALEMLGKEVGMFKNKLVDALEKSLEDLIGGSWGAKAKASDPLPDPGPAAPLALPEPNDL